MREIEFRAWLKDEKRMVVDEQVFIPLIVTNKGIMKLNPNIREDNYYFVGEQEEDYILMQYTGLKDKKLKKIFEGDIVKFDNKLYKVIWDNDECRFGLTNNVENTLLLLTSWRMQKLEVIGNIYENRELIENA